MLQTVTKTKKSFAVPIRLSFEEKYVLEEFSKKANLPLSTYIKSKLRPVIQTRLSQLSKTQILLDKIKSANISDKEIDLATEKGQEFRKNFKLTKN